MCVHYHAVEVALVVDLFESVHSSASASDEEPGNIITLDSI